VVNGSRVQLWDGVIIPKLQQNENI